MSGPQHPESIAAKQGRPLGGFLRPKSIVLKLTIMSSALIVITLGLFVLITLPYQRKAILAAMASEARSTVTSIAQVTASAIITEDFGTVVEHCLKVVKESPSISYVVVTRNDGFSVQMTKTGWVQTTLNGPVWTPQGTRVPSSRFLKSAVAADEVYHYSYPFQYSGIDWGWIHIGLSLKKFNDDIVVLYFRTALLALLCLSVGIAAALMLARKLTRPILSLAQSSDLVATGDLGIRVQIKTGDELERLGQSFNAMTERLQATRGEIMAAQEALLVEKEKAEAASRAKSQFLANMSHEIRTPMNGLLGMLSLLMETPLNEKQCRLTGMATSYADILLEIINNILDFSKIEAGKLLLQPVNFRPRDTVREVMNIFWLRSQEKSINLTSELDPCIPAALNGDSIRLRQILINLIGNALKFTERGEVSLGVTLKEKSPESLVLRFEVGDTGCGISPDKQKAIFEVFSQADNSMTRRHEGTGLGLAISKQLVEAMGGSIGVRSNPGQGSLFWFTVCMKQVPASSCPVHHETSAEVHFDWPVRERQLRALLAEDNIVNQEYCKMVLESLNFQVDVVDNGHQAVAAVSGKDYDIVLMDCRMPGMDGFEATRIIRERESEKSSGRRRVTIIALTANAMNGDRELCLATGMDDYLAKPFTLQQIRYILQRWLQDEGTDSPDAIAHCIDTLHAKERALAESRGETEATERPEVIDRSYLESILALQQPDAPNVLDTMIGLFFKNSPGYMNAMHHALASADAVGLWNAAHAFKSCCAILGALPLSAMCRQIESMGRENALDGAEELLAAIDREYGAACTTLEALLPLIQVLH